MMGRNLLVYIYDLDISERNKNALMRIGIMTLNDLENRRGMDFSKIHGLGVSGLQELQYVLEHADEIFKQFEVRQQKINAVYEEVSDISVEELPIGARVSNMLHCSGIHSIGAMIKMSKKDIADLHNVGIKTRNEISEVIEGIISEGRKYIDKSHVIMQIENQTDEKENVLIESSQKKGFDFLVIDFLIENFGFKISCMTEWFGLSRQGIYNAVEKKSPKRSDVWTGKEMTRFEVDILINLIRRKSFDYCDDEVTCCCMNNKQDNFVCIYIYENEIKCFFLKDLSEELYEKVIAANFHRYTERELSGGTEGDIVTVLKQKYFSPIRLESFRSLAFSRGLTVEEYARFLTGYSYIASRNVTDEIIIEFFENNMIDGKVYISSESKNQWIRSYASRNGYGIKEFIEFYGYESYLGGDELTTDGARERHIEELNQYILRDNVIYFPTDSHIYRVLQTYTYNKGITVKEYIRSLGFERTTEKPKIIVDVTEKDMQIYHSDGKFEEKVFAYYPLVGSKILKPEALDKLNENARRYIDTVLREPLTKLTLRAEMQITLALINYAKNWKNEENGNFWNYISLQFGYRDTNGAVVHLLQSALEDSMKRNCRLFIEDSNGRAFKTTVVIHALTTKKSWMALYDFLFDFYKNNLNWKIIQGDPHLELMIHTLQKKLTADGEDDAELTISSRIYSFQEGIRKLILLRPIFARQLFEKLICKIDAMVNSRNMPVKTYEEQLGEEWFKEKITAIANTKRTERQSRDVLRDVAIDYSRIIAKYVLRNENDVQLVLPDIRLKSEEISRAMIYVYYNDSIAYQQNMSWYGNELGKTLNGVTISLPELPKSCERMNIRVQITCDNEIIYNSEETLDRRVLVFAATNEISANQMKRDNYTLVMPESAVIEVENAEITEVDFFKNKGLKAYFTELGDGYVLAVDGKLLSFDSEGGSNIRVISPVESSRLPGVTANDIEYHLAYRDSVCRIILGKTDLLQQFVVMKNGNKLELSSLPVMESGSSLAFACTLFDGESICRIQIINLGDERLLFDRSFILISEAECSFNREFYYSSSDYKEAAFHIQIDDFQEDISFSQEDEEVRIPFRNGELHVSVPKIEIQETTGEWLNGLSPAWYIGDIPQNSFLKVINPERTEVKFLVDGKDIMYDGHGIVSLGNVLQTFSCTEKLSSVDVEMVVNGIRQNSKYILTRVFYKECFLQRPEFWTNDNKLSWNQGGMFIGRKNRIFTLSLYGEKENLIEFQLDEKTESIDIPEDLHLGNYRYAISILTGSLFKKTKEVIAEGDCIIGDKNLLRFMNRCIVVEAITDEFKEESGRISIRPCYIDKIQFMGKEETSEGYCSVYQGVMFTEGYHGERYEFSFDSHINERGIAKMMVNPVRIVYVNDTTLCITDTDCDGLYYYYYYDKYLETKVYALTDREYTNANKHKYSNADLYSYRTERINDV